MLDIEIINLANRQIQLDIDRQVESLKIEIGRIGADASRRGVYLSSMHFQLVEKACANAVIARGEFVWNILFRCINTVGVSYDADIEQQLKTAVNIHFPEHMNDLKHYVEEIAKKIGMLNTSSLPNEIEKARLASLNKIYTEIELFLLKLKKTPSEAPYNPPQINIHNSNIGALQTGSGSTANVSQQIDTHAVQEIIKALTLLQKELPSIEALPQNDKSEIIELVDDGIIELKKEKPNFSKVKSFISSIGAAIGVTADLKPAYDTLKVAAAMIGLNLPDL